MIHDNFLLPDANAKKLSFEEIMTQETGYTTVQQKPDGIMRELLNLYQNSPVSFQNEYEYQQEVDFSIKMIRIEGTPIREHIQFFCAAFLSRNQLQAIY